MYNLESLYEKLFFDIFIACITCCSLPEHMAAQKQAETSLDFSERRLYVHKQPLVLSKIHGQVGLCKVGL